jgi:hypothetical protein
MLETLAEQTDSSEQEVLASAQRLAKQFGITIETALYVMAQAMHIPHGQPGSEFPGPSSSGRANPVVSDEFFKRLPGVGTAAEIFGALKSVEDERNNAMQKLREDTRRSLQ